MGISEIRRVLGEFPDARLLEANGDVFAVHDPDGDYEQHPTFPWATLVTSDAYDSASDLDRPGVHRLNIGLPKDRFRDVVDVEAEHNTTALDVLLPHPVYGGQHWICVLNPDRTWPEVRRLLGEAHAFAERKHNNAARRRERRDADH